MSKKGKVYIVGAGPGDIELLTLKGKRIIEEADCIVYDRLINPNILNYTKKETELIYLGKGNTEGGVIQNEINEIIVKKALEGKIVVRLKGGDPFVFGRGGEEIQELLKKEIEFEEVPGITSSISVPAYAGIPVTHRGLARSFHVFTGHTMENGEWHNFEPIAKLEGTLIFLMGIKNLSLIVNELLKNGKNPKTPIGIIEKGATANQRVTTGNLDNILEIAEKRCIVPPAIIVVGEVVNLRDSFNWFEKSKLFGKKILVTRDIKQSEEFSKEIEKLGGIAIELPFIKIEGKLSKITKENLKGFSALLFNSPNGVREFFDKLDDIRDINNVKIGVVGSKTKEVIESYRIKPDFMPNEYLVDKLAEEAVKYTKDGDKILIVTSDISPCDIEKYNLLYGRIFEKLEAYKTKKIIRNKDEVIKSLKEVDTVTFLSSSTVEAFMESIKNDLGILKDKKIISIGPVTTTKIKEYGLNVDKEAKKYSVSGIIEILKS